MSTTIQNNAVIPVTNRTATIHLVQSSRFALQFAKLLLLGLFLSALGMMFLPWQQTSRGTGQVVAYVPQERQQSVESPTKGVIARIEDGLVEGSKVQEGQFILEIQPFASNMREQLTGQLNELNTKLETANVKAEAYGEMIVGYTEARDFAVQAAEELVGAAEAKLESKRRQVMGYEAKELQARLNFERQQSLANKGLKPTKEIEKLKKEWEVAKSEVGMVDQDVQSLRQELSAKQSELEEKRRVNQTKIDYARAMEQDALGMAATVRKDIADIQMKLEEMKRMIITAPRDGTIFRLPVYERGDTIKAGEPILILIPDSSQKAVELYISGNDMPLVREGMEVRLQFEGWPAVQFAGWPSVAIGSFSGYVSTIDATDNGKGEFRILVSPNELEQTWPSDQYLRQGVRVNGWVMLNEVRLGWEVWRQLNGFPVIISGEEPSAKQVKTPKLPK